MIDTIRDVRFNWHQANIYFGDKKRPHIDVIKKHGVKPINTETSVLIPVTDQRYRQRLFEIQDWLERTKLKHQIYARYRIHRNGFDVDKIQIGLVFVFRTMDDMATFFTTFGR